MEQGNQSEQSPFLVVIGASAGGIASLSAVVSALPHDLPAPVVIALHLSPDRKSLLTTILERQGPLPVKTLDERTLLEPGFIFVVPPGRNLRIAEGQAVLERHGEGSHPSIDLAFRSAAETYRENLIAVVLSGSGSDGALGAREVKRFGGTVIIEDPSDAEFSSMPLSLSPTDVDVAVERERIGDVIVELINGSFEMPPGPESSQVRMLMEELRDELGVDFANYRQATIQRRIQRRMVATGQTTFGEYLSYMRQDVEERQRLAKSFLINVTQFFRDPELFDYLRDQVLPELINEARSRNGELRIWSAGCSTGEEAYSLAIVIDQLLSELDEEIDVRIFATDLDEEAIAFARRGIFPGRALAELPEDVVEKHFTPLGDEFEVRKPIRSLLVFGEHDLSRRSPFPRIDMILCRNVLIYFTPPLQRRALEMFGFSLRNGGYLVLGKSESVSPLQDHFAVDQARLKVFRRVGKRGQVLRPPLPAETATISSVRVSQSRTQGPGSLARPARVHPVPPPVVPSWDMESLLYALPYGLVVVDTSYDIQYINSEARTLLGIHATAHNHDLIHLVQRYDPLELRRLIDAVLHTGQSASRVLTSADGVGDAIRRIEVVPVRIAANEAEGNEVAISILDVTERERLRERLVMAEESAARLAEANEEVLSANHHLTQSLNRLRNENEQMQVISAEIQAATEEVETLNEELQASNEELETLNEELQATVEELNTTNDDLESRSLELHAMAVDAESARQQLRGILDAVEHGIIVVDGHADTVLVSREFNEIFGNGLDGAALRTVDGSPMHEDQTPIARAARGEAFTMPFCMEVPGKPSIRYEAVGRPVAMPGRRRLGVITVRPYIDSDTAQNGVRDADPGDGSDVS